MEFAEFWYRYRPDLYKKVTVFGNSLKNAQKKQEKCLPKMVENLEGAALEQLDPGEYARLPGNIRRASATVEELSLCNDWDMFFTGTVSPALRDRCDLDGYRKALSQLIRDIRRCTGCELSYLIVPEQHRKGQAWHMHGLIRGLPVSELRPFGQDEHLPHYLLSCLRGGRDVYDWPAYRSAFGWCVLDPIRSRDAAARYCAKYIRKGWDSTAAVLAKGKQLYYCSQGLRRRQRLDASILPQIADYFETAAPYRDDSKYLGEGGYRSYIDDASIVKIRLASAVTTDESDGGVIPLSLITDQSYDYEYGSVRWYTTTPDSDSIQ